MNGLMFLDALAQKLACPLPSLKEVEHLLSYGELPGTDDDENSEMTPEEMTRFTELVREYIPERADKIRREPYFNEKIGWFFHYFQQKYFPLDDYYVQTAFENGEDMLDCLTYFIPVQYQAFEEDYYHESGEMREGFRLMLALLVCPIDSEGAKGAVLDGAKELVGEELPALIPPLGWTIREIEKLVTGTPYAGLDDFARWVNHETGCQMLDTTQEEATFDNPSWTRGEVERLTAEWRRARVIQKRFEKLADWLEEKPSKHFRLLLGHLLGKPLPMPLAEVFDKEETDAAKIKTDPRLRPATRADLAAIGRF